LGIVLDIEFSDDKHIQRQPGADPASKVMGGDFSVIW